MICFATNLRQTPVPCAKEDRGGVRDLRNGWIKSTFTVSSGSEFSPKPVFPVFFFLISAGRGRGESRVPKETNLFLSSVVIPPASSHLLCYLVEYS